jgi:hypothetical protein
MTFLTFRIVFDTPVVRTVMPADLMLCLKAGSEVHCPEPLPEAAVVLLCEGLMTNPSVNPLKSSGNYMYHLL